MDHVAIMKKSWGLLPKVITGQKMVESRWSKSRCRPWSEIGSGDTVYFKDSGEPVCVRAKVAKVLRFSDLNHDKVWEILQRYGREDGLEEEELSKYFEMFKDKKYCLLVFLRNPTKISPFRIDKRGFGAMSAWISVGDIEAIRVK
ncbi:MAG: hypothetical protein Q8L46_01855 [candidate division WWE3 bacterium]|nr:hypothetical protein [candidate division WWE3 bacterium]